MTQLETRSSSLRQRVGEHSPSPAQIGLDDDRQFLHAAFGNLGLQRFQREPRALPACALSFACVRR